MLAIVAAAAAMALPDPGKAFQREILSDLPRELKEADLAAMWYEASVDETGTITDCKVRGAFGDAAAARKICAVIEGKTVKPGSGPTARPMPSSFRAPLVLIEGSIPDRFLDQKADVWFEVSPLPGGAKKPVQEQLVVLVDEEGSITECTAAKTASSLTAKACEEVRAVNMPARENAKGEAIAYLFPVIFEFTTKLPDES